MLIGIDTGGTFTDFVVLAGGRIRIHKVLSTPEAPERAILQGLRELGCLGQTFRLVHGSTVATNAVLEGKGARTAYVTNRGFGDVLSIGRQARARLYDLQPPLPPPPVPAELCWETGGRLAADGSTLEPLTEADLARLVDQVRRERPEAVAINLLFSFRDDRWERRIAERLAAEGVFLSRSSRVLPEYREYERGMATWLNASVGPRVAGYLQRLATAVAPAPVAVMQSAGTTVAAAQAAERGVQLLLSGPAGGLTGARFVASLAGYQRLLTFDMGGTSTDVALIDGAIRLTTEGRIGRYPVALPMVDMHTIGAGGGSIARVDAGGLLQVGPQSAGADPGPACYGRGGREPTVTDANLVLGRLRPDAFLGGRMRLDPAAARAAVGRLAWALGLELEAAAAGILRLANEHMVRALREISVSRGMDPAGAVLVSFGGAGGLHLCALAEALRIRRALVPVHAGVLSALGMIASRPGRVLSRTLARPLVPALGGRIEQGLAQLAQRGRAELVTEGVAPDAMEIEHSLDLRYQGQSHTLELPWQGVTDTGAAFHRLHQARYGHRLDLPVEVVNLRVAVRGAPPPLQLEPLPTGTALGRPDTSGPIPAWPRAALVPGQRLSGPLLVTETVATTYLAPGWALEVDGYGNLLLTFGGPDPA